MEDRGRYVRPLGERKEGRPLGPRALLAAWDGSSAPVRLGSGWGILAGRRTPCGQRNATPRAGRPAPIVKFPAVRGQVKPLVVSVDQYCVSSQARHWLAPRGRPLGMYRGISSYIHVPASFGRKATQPEATNPSLTSCGRVNKTAHCLCVFFFLISDFISTDTSRKKETGRSHTCIVLAHTDTASIIFTHIPPIIGTGETIFTYGE